MPDEKGPIDSIVHGALDLFVYVPVGLAVSAKELVPELARRGRERVTGQVTSARVVGRFAVQQGQAQASKAYQRARVDAEQRLADERAAAAPPAAPVPPTPAPTAHSGPGAESLAVPGYDSLSASQVLPRLEGLAPEELEAVRAYEAAHRGRKTILGRIAQLQA
jgi:hypothetical protein